MSIESIANGSINGSLTYPNTLTVVGSTALGSIASEEAYGNTNGQNTTQWFANYWNNLAANSGSAAVNLNGVTVVQQDDKTVLPTLANGTADIGGMSRPPTLSSTEWNGPSLNGSQVWAVGVDGMVIVLSPDMTWFPTDLTTLQVAMLFSNNAPFQNTLDAPQNNPPMFSTWGDFFVNQSISTAGMTDQQLNEPINRVISDPSSGEFACFNNYFAVPNGFQFKHDTNGSVDGTQNMAPYQVSTGQNSVYNSVLNGTTNSNSDTISFLSLATYLTYGGVRCESVAFNIAQTVHISRYPRANNPYDSDGNSTGTSMNSVTHYYGPSNTWGQCPYKWSQYTAPTKTNVIWSYSGIKFSGATTPYYAYYWLWEVTPNPILTNSPLLATGVWIAYMRAWNTTTNKAPVATVGSGKSDFVADNNYIQVFPVDMAGGPPVDPSLNKVTTAPGQTQNFPDGQIAFNDIAYFVSGYIQYYTRGIYNPYLDINADGKISFADIQAFVHLYLQYYQVYNPLYVNPYS